MKNFISLLIICLLVLHSFCVDQLWDFDLWRESAKNLKRRQLFHTLVTETYAKQQCQSNIDLINNFLSKLKSNNIEFQQSQEVIHQKILLDWMLQTQPLQKFWKSWDEGTKQYYICRYNGSTVNRRPMKQIDFNNIQSGVNATIARYPYLKIQMQSRSITYLLSLLPHDLKERITLRRFIIYNNSIYKQRFCQYNGWNVFKHKLHYWSGNIPDIDFVTMIWDTIPERHIHEFVEQRFKTLQEVDLKHDLYKKVFIELPLFQWSKDLNNTLEFNKFLMIDNLMNDAKIWSGDMMEAKAASKEYPWECKIDKAFFRGAQTGSTRKFIPKYKDIRLTFPRLYLNEFSVKNPDLLDSKMTTYGNAIMEYIEQPGIQTFKEKISISDQIKHKYLLSADGWSAAWVRVEYTLMSNTLLIKQYSTRIQWFYDSLKPNIHFLAVKNDWSDLKQKILWARQNDDLARNITIQAQEYANKRFSVERIHQDFIQILTDYAYHQNISAHPPDLQYLQRNGLQYFNPRGEKRQTGYEPKEFVKPTIKKDPIEKIDEWDLKIVDNQNFTEIAKSCLYFMVAFEILKIIGRCCRKYCKDKQDMSVDEEEMKPIAFTLNKTEESICQFVDSATSK